MQKPPSSKPLRRIIPDVVAKLLRSVESHIKKSDSPDGSSNPASRVAHLRDHMVSPENIGSMLVHLLDRHIYPHHAPTDAQVQAIGETILAGGNFGQADARRIWVGLSDAERQDEFLRVQRFTEWSLFNSVVCGTLN